MWRTVTLSSLPTKIDLSRYHKVLGAANLVKVHGKVTQIIGLIIESEGPGGNVGDLSFIYSKESPRPVRAEVVGFKNNKVLLMPLGEMTGIGPGCEVRTSGKPLAVKVGPALLGRVLDGLGNPMDGKGPLETTDEFPVQNSPPNPITRPRITEALTTGVRVIDSMLTLGKGQRIGIFAGSGVGKSTTLSMIARNTSADINVIGLIGERGRELRDFIERDLGEEGLRRSVVVCATSDKPALIRIKGAYVATAMAEYFREQGKDVILMMDSVTRFAMAQREVGLAIGEPPATKGYTPSVFALLPKLLERSGTSDKGSITGIYTVLVEGDDMNEPIADQVRSILDGHIVLSRAIAHQNQYPSVDVLQSVSRLFTEVNTEEHQQMAAKVRKILDTYRKKEDLINIGAYVDGSDPDVDHAKRMIKDTRVFLGQGIFEPAPFDDSLEKMRQLLSA
ncbi:MAG: flagellar protein export ATPase FliI [Armatimonadetes bacterium]|nr:flagellar protein export ATPase FliI [Armatimonadota bacterium]